MFTKSRMCKRCIFYTALHSRISALINMTATKRGASHSHSHNLGNKQSNIKIASSTSKLVSCVFSDKATQTWISGICLCLFFLLLFFLISLLAPFWIGTTFKVNIWLSEMEILWQSFSWLLQFWRQSSLSS